MSDRDANLPHLVEVAGLKPYSRNARTHSPEQVEQIKASFRRYGFTGVLAYDEQGLAIEHGRQRALLQMWDAGEEVMGPGKRAPLPRGRAPAVDISGLSADDRRALILADNQIALAAGWDNELLALELGALSEVGFDLTLTGFRDEEIAPLLGPTGEQVTAAVVTRVDVSRVEDQFWISVRGPLLAQADVLLRLRAVMNDYPAVTVDMGVTQRDAR